MSLKMALNDRKFVGDRYLGAFRSRQADRGKKAIDDKSNYKSCDFIHDSHRETRSDSHAPVATNDTRQTKFKKGFYRRHMSDMDVTSKRTGDEARRAERFKNHQPRRLGNIIAIEQRNGNIIADRSGQSQPAYRPYKHVKRAEAGKAENENTKRQMKDPTSRFHALITSEQRDRHRQRRELIQKGLNPASSDIGVGRRDIASNGVQDNFNYPQHAAKMTRISRYGRAHVDSKARHTNFHVGEQGRSSPMPTRDATPMRTRDITRDPTPMPRTRDPTPTFNASPAPVQVRENRFL